MEIKGIFVPIVTPFDGMGRLYEKGINEIINYIFGNGIKGLWLLGSYGAFPLMSTEERMRMAEIAVPLALKLGMTTIVHIGDPSTDTAILLAKHAEGLGAHGLASVVPFYYASSHLRENHIVAHFKKILQEIRIPLFFYNNSKATGYTPKESFLRRLMEVGVYGLKDKGDYVTMAEHIILTHKVRPGGVYLSGTTSVYLLGHILGAQGVVSGTALAMPGLVLSLEAALNRHDLSEAVRLQEIVLKVRKVQGRYVGRSVSCYDILAEKKVDAGTCRLPWNRMTREQALEVLLELRELETSI